jgi:ribonuclease R
MGMEDVEWGQARSASARRSPLTSARSGSARIAIRSGSVSPAEPAARRLIGRALRARGRWLFDPARRWRGGRRDLAWRGSPEPQDGDWCVAEVPDDGPARLVEVLGADDRPEWDDAGVVSQFRLRTAFPAAALAEAAAGCEPGAAERHGRLDLREALVFTIDPEDARDHDDALSLRAAPAGRVEVGIHIADVSHYVAAGGALDTEAMARGTSCYLPGGAVPMLPEALSADLCSLRPGRDRLALSVLAELDREGHVFGWRFAETVVHSRHRLHYGEVQAALDGARPLEPGLQRDVELLMRLARALRRRRLATGALELDVPEVKAWVDEHGVPWKIERRPHLESHELVEEFMLLANRCVGEEGARRHAGLLYRVHEAPSPARLTELDVMLGALALPRLGLADAARQGRHGAPLDPATALQTLLRAPLDPPHRLLLHRLVLRSLARARYQARDVGHFGLAAREYCHFTSPIRRYPDLHNHRRVREWIRGGPDGAWDPVETEALGVRCSATEETATAAEREATRVKGLRLLEGRLGDRASGIVSGLVPQGLFVELGDVPVEGFVRVSLYLEDQFTLDRTGVRMVGRRTRRRFCLGDAVKVTIARVDVPARECDLALDATMRRGVSRRRRRRGRRD